MSGKFTKKLNSLLFVLFSFAASAEKVQKLKLVSEHFPPYQIQDSKGEVHGYSTEILKAALAHTQLDYEIKIYPWTRTYHLAQTEKNTCIYLIAKLKQRKNLFQWVEPIVTTTDYFIGLSDNKDIKIDSIDDAKKYKVAVLKDDRTHTMLLDMGFVEQKNLYVINSTYSLLKLLISRNEIDLILADTINVVYRAKYNEIDPEMFKAFYKVSKSPVDLYLACSISTDPSIVSQLSDALTVIKNNGQFDEIGRRWNLIQ